MSGASRPGPRRRAVLATIGAGATGLTSGCVRQVRNLVGWQAPRQVQLQIKTLPADADPYALRLAQRIAEWFRAAGLAVSVVPLSEQELRRRTLLRDEFDVFLMRLPEQFHDPDGLYSLLHSRFADAPGWQNPFGYANLDVDALLEQQRRQSGSARRETLARLQTTAARTQPFTVLAFPDAIRAARSTSYTGWGSVDLESSLGYLGLERIDDGSETGNRDDRTLGVAVTDRRATTNLNPLSVEFRRNGVFTGLLYDPLGHPVDDEVRPWLAASWGFTDGERPSARVTLREGVTWHDGEPLTASDVAFTYTLLADTTLGTTDGETEDVVPVPSPRFRGRSSLVDEVRVVDETTVAFQFDDVDTSVAPRAFHVPVLPEHVWEDRTDTTSIGGVELGAVPEALVVNNVPPVGSGPLKFVRNAPRERLVLERFDDHFLGRADGSGGGLAASVEGVPFDRLVVRVVGSDVTAVESVAGGSADVTGTTVGAGAVPRIGRSDEVDLLVGRSARPYVLGYNTRRSHLNNPQVRNALAHLVDADHLLDAVLDGYGSPAVGPLWGTDWYPDSLEWTDGNPVTPFLGDDGEVDVAAARDTFRQAGYRYDDGRLVGGRT